MYEFSECEIIFLKEWLKEIMDVKGDYEIIKPDLSERGLDTALYIKVITDAGWHKNRIDLTVRELQLCTNEELLDKMNKARKENK